MRKSPFSIASAAPGRRGIAAIAGLIVAAVLSGCATPPPAQGAAPGSATDLPWLARYVSAQLEAAAEGDQARLAAIELEMRRISDALPAARVPESVQTGAMNQTQTAQPTETTQTPPPDAPVQPEAAPQSAVAAPAQAEPEPQSAPAYAAAPQLSGARSLFSALTLGSYPDADTARAAWFGMNAGHGQALAGLDARIEARTREGGATVYVLKAGPFATAQEAEARCETLRAAGAVCQPGDFTGAAL